MREAILVLVLLLTACAAEDAKTEVLEQIADEPETKVVKNMKLTSNDFKHGEKIPVKFTCQGDDVNPQLALENAPDGVKSFALIVDDPDAPMGVWIHWLVHGIPANVKEIKQNSVPGNQVENDFGKKEYGGPCPPSGVHRYFFRLYALDVETLEGINKDNFRDKVEEHAIAKAELMGTYEKS